MILAKHASFKGFFVLIALALLGLVACSGGSTPSVESPEDKAFEEVLFAATAENQAFFKVTASDTEFTAAADTVISASDSLLGWIVNFEQTAADLTSSLTAQQLDLGEFNDVVPEEVKQVIAESYARQVYEECLKMGSWADEFCAGLQRKLIESANKLAGAVKTADGDAYLFGNSPARPSQPTTIKVTQNGESDPAALLWSFCQDFNAERKCHLISLGGKTGEILPVPFMPVGTETVKLVIKVERRPPSVVSIDFQEGKEHVIDVSNPKDPYVVVGELETGSCQDIGALASNAGDPAPGETVFVKVFVSPPAKGCKITYSLVGTDGYAQADTLITDIEGGASFSVPGGAQGVVDEIDFKTENGITLTETYTF